MDGLIFTDETNVYTNVQTVGGDFAPGMQPLVTGELPPADRGALPAPAPLPVLAAPAPVAVPQAVPVPRASPAPGGAPSFAPGTAPSPSITPAPSPAPAVVPELPAPLPVPARGPLPAAAPGPVVATPAQAVVLDGKVVGGPALAPAPTLTAMAAELGRLERKGEMLLERTPDAAAAEVLRGILLSELQNAIRDAVKDLFNDVPGGSFQLIPPCPPPGGGDPLPPVVVPYEGATNPSLGILAKLDGIADLIQAHKTMGQPTCKTVVHGEEVTVHFESES